MPPSKPKHQSRDCQALKLLQRDEYYDYYHDRICRLVVARRTPKRFEAPEAIGACFDQAIVILRDIDRGSSTLLIDVRDGPSRNDPEFEQMLARHRGKMLRGFSRIATLTTTRAGVLHVQRLANDDGLNVTLSDDPEQLFAELGLPRHDWPRSGV